MNKITLIVLFLLAVAGAVAVFLLDDEKEAPPEELALFPGLLKEDVSEMTWATPGKAEVTVRREGDEWYVVMGESEVPAASLMVEEVLNELKRTQIEKKFPENEAHAQKRMEWELESPPYYLRFLMRGESQEVRMGKESLSDGTVFAQTGPRETDRGVVLMGTGLRDSFKGLTAAKIRRRRLLDMSVTDVQSVNIEKNGETVFTAARSKTQQFMWRATYPFKAFVDPQAMDTDLLPAVLGIEAEEFPADNVGEEKLGEYGLADPRCEVALTEKDTGTVRTVLIGDSPEGKEKVFYYMEQGKPFVYLSKRSNLLLKLAEDPASWRDRNITRLGYSPIGRVYSRLGESSFEMENLHGEWHLVKPEKALLDQDATENDWLATVRDASALEFRDDPDLAELGLDDPRGELTFWRPKSDVHVHGEEEENANEDAEEEVLLRLLIGKGPGDREGVWVMREGEPQTAYLAPGKFIDLLARSYYPMKQRTVFIGAEAGERKVSMVLRTYDGKKTELTSVDGKWPDGVREAALTSVVAKLLDLKAVRWIGPAEGKTEGFGLGDSSFLSLRVTMVSEDGEAKKFGVDAGKKTEGGRFALAFRDGEPLKDVFVIPSRLTDPVMEDLGDGPVPVDRGLQVPLTEDEGD